jgi:two-component system, cell cycle sensor histidine kinase and response regulator CckA
MGRARGRGFDEFERLAEEWAKGILDNRLDVTSADLDMQRLAKAFNRVADKLEECRQSCKIEDATYHHIFNSTPIGVFTSCPDGQYRDVNPAMAKILGYESPSQMLVEITDITAQTFVNPEDGARLCSMVEETGLVEGFEVERRKKDGNAVWTLVSCRLVEDEGGDRQRRYYVGIVEDISERKNLENRLVQAQKMEAIGQLAGTIAHDFNNILTVLIGSANLLQSATGNNHPMREYVEQILAVSEKAAGLTKSLLLFSRKQKTTVSLVNLNDTVRKTGELLPRLLPENIELRVFLSATEATVMADPTQFDQVLFNLASNARDALPGGGTIVIETSNIFVDAETASSKGLAASGTYALLSVSDNGDGMSEATTRRIFEPFFTTKEKGKGTGLGLSTVYEIIAEHKGHIEVESSVGKGTIFRIYLPLSLEGRQKETTAARSAPKKGTETILIAEDDATVRQLIKEILGQSGYSTIEAVDGDEGGRMFDELGATIDLVLIDAVMPKKNGRQMYEEIRKIDPHKKVLFTSGYAEDFAFGSDVRDDNVEFMSKPLAPLALLAKVRSFLDRE